MKVTSLCRGRHQFAGGHFCYYQIHSETPRPIKYSFTAREEIEQKGYVLFTPGSFFLSPFLFVEQSTTHRGNNRADSKSIAEPTAGGQIRPALRLLHFTNALS